MSSMRRNAAEGLSLPRSLFLLFGYLLASCILGLVIGFATVHALYPGVAVWPGLAVVAALSVAVIGVCWLTMPANRPHVGALVLRVAMAALLPVGIVAVRRLILNRGPASGREVLILAITAAAFGMGLWMARGTRWGRKWAS